MESQWIVCDSVYFNAYAFVVIVYEIVNQCNEINTIKIPPTRDTYVTNYWPPLSGRLHALLQEQAFQSTALEFIYTEKSTNIT